MKNKSAQPVTITKALAKNNKKHRSFQEMLSSDSTVRKCRRKKIAIPEETVTDSEGFNNISYSTYYVLESRISLHPEAIVYFYSLEGCAKNLLLYIIGRELNVDTAEFLLNKQVRDRFSDYCLIVSGKKYGSESLKKAVKTLVNRNCIMSHSRGAYSLNPVLAGGNGEDQRRHLIKIYASKLKQKGKAISVSLLPKYDSKQVRAMAA
jgi:hypothetical protein